MKSFLLVATLAFACGGEQSKQAEPAPAPAEPVNEPAVAVFDAGVTTPTAEGAVDCVKECVASRQMQAISIDQIERDCQEQCSEQAPSELNGQ
ncbi:MAG: hypothetical protein GY811_13940 [Myxococcales bacterium]|nr:hypothetical protein [Myxococcales bacterium]